MINKLIYLITICSPILLIGQISSYHTSGKLNPEQVAFLAYNYNWNDESLLLINFVHSKDNCHYDVGAAIGTKKVKKWWVAFYEKVDLTNISNRFIYADKIASKKVVNGSTHFEDKQNFIFETFFTKHRYCYGVVVISKNGRFHAQGSEYNQKVISQFVESLR